MCQEAASLDLRIALKLTIFYIPKYTIFSYSMYVYNKKYTSRFTNKWKRCCGIAQLLGFSDRCKESITVFSHTRTTQRCFRKQARACGKKSSEPSKACLLFVSQLHLCDGPTNCDRTLRVSRKFFADFVECEVLSSSCILEGVPPVMLTMGVRESFTECFFRVRDFQNAVVFFRVNAFCRRSAELNFK